MLLIVRVGDRDVNVSDMIRLVSDYARQHSATIEYYDLNGDPQGTCEPSDSVTLADLGRMTLINADLNGSDAVRLLALQLPWNSIAPLARLEDADPDEPDGLYWVMSSMWSDLRALRGIGPAKASKLLHLKRPLAFPILDRDVRKTYESRYRQSNSYWREMRLDLIEGAAELAALGTALSASEEASVRLAGRLPGIRLLDICAWMQAQKPGK
jgi:hypothetical protein